MTAVAAFTMVVSWTNHLISVIMTNNGKCREMPIYRQQFFFPYRQGADLPARISNLLLVLHKCNI